MFGKAGMRWLWSITSKLTELDQFIFDAELRHIETLKGLIKEVETRIAKELAESEDVKLLVGIPVPGVNYYTALSKFKKTYGSLLVIVRDLAKGLALCASNIFPNKLQQRWVHIAVDYLLYPVEKHVKWIRR